MAQYRRYPLRSRGPFPRLPRRDDLPFLPLQQGSLSRWGFSNRSRPSSMDGTRISATATVLAEHFLLPRTATEIPALLPASPRSLFPFADGHGGLPGPAAPPGGASPWLPLHRRIPAPPQGSLAHWALTVPLVSAVITNTLDPLGCYSSIHSPPRRARVPHPAQWFRCNPAPGFKPAASPAGDFQLQHPIHPFFASQSR